MFCENLDLHHYSKKADLLADMKEDGEKDENLLSLINPLFGDDLQKTISDICPFIPVSKSIIFHL